MKKVLLLIVVVLSSLALAQQQQHAQQQGGKLGMPQGLDTCAYSYSSGPASTFTRYCLSGNGNIVQFDSPQGYEYINAGDVGEGYGVCDLTGTTTAYYDYADVDSGNWGATVVSAPSATSRKFVRSTIDGIWQLAQTISQVKANASGPGSVKAAMALKNLTGISRDVYFLRYADVDANATFLDDRFDSTLNLAFGADPGASNGLGLSNNTFSFLHTAFTQSVSGGPDPCNPTVNFNSNPFSGDGSIGQIYLLTVPAGATKTVTVTYKPI